MAYRIIYGTSVKYSQKIESGEIELLSERREAATLVFANKAVKSDRFSKWFKQTPVTSREVRSTTRNLYVEAKCKTERMRANPVQYMTRKLNEEHRKAL